MQIKGKEAPDQSRNEITYQFNCDNLRHYLRDGGAMLFVVYLSVVLDADGCDDIKKTIYYNTLTPVKLMQILQGIKRADQETIAVRLTRLPRASQDLSNIYLNSHPKIAYLFLRIPRRFIVRFNHKRSLS